MTNRTENRDFELVRAVTNSMENEHAAENERWEESPFLWLTGMAIKTKGMYYERIVTEWLSRKGLEVTKAKGTDADRAIQGSRTEFKVAMLGKNDTYVFNRIRDQDYRILLCVGLSPSSAHLWAIPKADVMRFRGSGRIPNQHANNPATGILNVPVNRIPDWLRPYGGSLSEGFARLRSLTG